MRNTNVVVIPNCAELSEFKTFDALVQAINMARRRARDFVVKKDEQEDEMSKWV
jgi:HD superfamily phosphohydrolase